jgi:hypothetical protein
MQKLTQIFSPAWQKEYGKYLTAYCCEHGIPVMKQAVGDAAWEQEHAYHEEVLADTHGPWLKRKTSQSNLTVLSTTHEKTTEPI